MREQMKALDDFEMGDQWELVQRRMPRADGPEPPWRRSLARPVMLLVASILVLGVVLYGLRALGSAKPTALSTGVPGVFMAVDPTTPNAYMLALSTSPVVVRDGCVLFGQDGHLSLPIWPKGFTADRNADGDLVIKDASGAVVGVEGQPLRMGGGYVAEFQPADKVDPKAGQVASVEDALGYQIPQQCLAGIYGIWQVGQIEAANPPDSSSPQTVALPDLVGLDVANAKSTLDRLGLDVETSKESSADPYGTISRQSPTAGTIVAPGDTVQLVVSVGLPGNDLGSLDCPSGQQSARIIYPPVRLTTNVPSETVEALVRSNFIGIQPTDQVTTSTSEGGTNVVVSRSGATIARAFLTPHLQDWMLAEVSSCATSGISPPQ